MILCNTAALQRLQEKFQRFSQQLSQTIEKAAQEAGEQVVEELSQAAPHGSSSSSQTIQGDTPGPLAGSFATRKISLGIKVVCTQPTKLKYVTQGTGMYGPYHMPIVPVSAKALYWPDASHPVKQVQGQKPNDFVTPVTTKGYEDVKQAVADAVNQLWRDS